MKYPRVLHVGFQQIGDANNSGLTLGSIFGEWPDDRLLQLCLPSHAVITPSSNTIIAPRSVAPVDGLVRTLLGDRLPPGSVDGLNHSVSRASLDLPLGLRFRNFASAANDIGPVWLPKHVMDRIRRFRPQVIHSLLGGVRPMRVVSAISRRLDLPVVPHFMDDWPDNLFTDGQLLGIARRSVVRTLDRVLRRVPLCLVIGEDMQKEYATRYKRQCVVVGNNVDLNAYGRLRMRPRPDSTLRMRYVGGLHLGRAEVLRTIARAMNRRRTDHALWRLELFVPDSDAALARALERELSPVDFVGSLQPNDVPQGLVDADALLFVESTEPHLSRFTRLSVSTKVPQYLASARPVLVIGPPEQGSVSAILRSGAGQFAGSADEAGKLELALDRIEESVFEKGPALSETKMSWVSSRFGQSETRARFRMAMAEASEWSTGDVLS